VPKSRPGVGARAPRLRSVSEGTFTRSVPALVSVLRPGVGARAPRLRSVSEGPFTSSVPGADVPSRCPRPCSISEGTITRSVPVPMIRLVHVFQFVRVKLSQGVT